MGVDRQNPSGIWHSASGTKVPPVPLWKKGCLRVRARVRVRVTQP
jgi:hypothetical protein